MSFKDIEAAREAIALGRSYAINDDYIANFRSRAQSFMDDNGRYNDNSDFAVSAKAIRYYLDRQKKKSDYSDVSSFLDEFEGYRVKEGEYARRPAKIETSQYTGGRNSLLPEGVAGPITPEATMRGVQEAIQRGEIGVPGTPDTITSNFAKQYANMTADQLQDELKRVEQVRAGAQRRDDWDDADELNYILKTDFLNSAIAAGGTVPIADQKRALEEQMAGYQQNVDRYNSFSNREKADYNLFAFLEQLGINGLGAWNAKQEFEGKEQYTLLPSDYVAIKEKYKAAQEQMPELQKQYDALLEQEKAQELAGILVSDPEGEIAQKYNFLSGMQNGLKDYENGEEKEKKLAQYAAQEDAFGLNEWAQAQLEQYQYNQKSGAEKFFGGLGSAALSGVSSISKLAATIPAAAADVFGADIRDTGYYKAIAGAADKYMEDNAKRKQLYANYTDDNWVLKGMSDAGRGIIEGTIQSLPFLMTGGASSAANTLQNNFANATYSAAGNVINGAAAMMKNPGYWLAFSQEFTNQYENALNSGATTEQAAVAGIVSGAINGGVEMGFGVQANFDDIMSSKSFRDFMSEAVSSAIEEGGEEIAQGFTGNLVDYLVWDKDKKAVSLDNDVNAVLNVPQMWESFKGGFFGSMGFGGFQVLQALNTDSQNKKALMNLAHRYMSDEFSTYLTAQGSTNAAEESKVLARILSGQNISKSQAETIKSSPAAIGFLNDHTRVRFEEAQSSADIQKLANGIAAFVRTGRGNDIVRGEATTQNEATPTEESADITTQAAPMTAEVQAAPTQASAMQSRSLPVSAQAVSEQSAPIGGQVVQSRSAAPVLGGTQTTSNIAANAPKTVKVTLEEKYQTNYPAPALVRTEGNGVERVEVNSFADSKKGTVYLSNGQVAPMNEVAFDNDAELEVYQAAMKYDTDTANAMINGYSGSPQYVEAFNSIYDAGDAGNSFDYAVKNFGSVISNTAARIAYSAGVKADNVTRQSAKLKDTGKYFGMTEAAKRANLTPTQKAQLSAVENFAKARKQRVVIVPDIDGGNTNAFYDPKNDTVVVALNAKENAYLYWMGHEIGHRVKELGKGKWNQLRKITLDYLERQTDFSLEDRIREVHDTYAKLDIEYSRAECIEEIVCNSIGTVFADETFVNELIQKDRSLAEKVRTWISEFIEDLKKALGKIGIDVPEARSIRKDIDTMQKIKDVLDMALSETEGVRVQSATQEVGADYDKKTESASPQDLKFSLNTWTKSEYMKNLDLAAEELASALGVSKNKAKTYLRNVNSVARQIANDRTRLDYEASPGRSPFVSNAEYGGSVDFTTLCKKRRLFTGTFIEIQKKLSSASFTANEMLHLRDMMKKRGFEVACGLCYVEGSRAKLGEYNKRFIEEYKSTNPEYLPDMYDLNTPTGQEELRINHPQVYDDYVKFMGKLAQRKPKLFNMRSEYTDEILKNFKDKDKVKDKNLFGGLRLQSFSDFEVPHLLDMMQVVLDMAKVGLYGQAYTKVPEFARVFGDTGIKINLSLIAKGVDSEGNLIFDNVEGMDFDTAMDIRKKHSENVGTILVVFTEDQLMAAMADDRIDFIIPFHRSQWSKKQYPLMGLPEGTRDFTSQQNERYIQKRYNDKGKALRPTNYMPNQYWDYTKSGKWNAERYLEMCAADGRRPKFAKYLQNNGDGSYSLKADGSTDGYWKLLIDFKMYDNSGKGVPQRAVKPDFVMSEADKILDEYAGGANTFPVAREIVDDFVKEYEGKHKYDQFKLSVNGRTIDAQNMTDEDAVEILTDVKKNRRTYSKNNYIPVRKQIPNIVIDEAIPYFKQILGETKKLTMLGQKNPVAMTVKKALNSMGEENQLSKEERHPHALTPKQVVDILDQGENPLVVIYQRNNDRILVVVRANGDNYSTGVSVYDVETKIGDQYIYFSDGGKYQVAVTVYPGDWVDDMKALFDEDRHNIFYFPQKNKDTLVDESSRSLESSSTNISLDKSLTQRINEVKEVIEEFRDPFKKLKLSINPTDKSSLPARGEIQNIVTTKDTELLKDTEGLDLTPAQQRQVTVYKEAVAYVDKLKRRLAAAEQEKAKADSQKASAAAQLKINSIEKDLVEATDIMDQRRGADGVQAALSQAVDVRLSDLIEKYGSFKPGYKPVREVSVPQKTTENRRVRRAVRTILESGAITDDMVPDLKRKIVEGEFSYTPVSDAESMAWAEGYLERNGYESGMKMWHDIVNGTRGVGKNDIALGEYLLQTASREGNVQDVLTISSDLARLGTRAGQAVQAFSMLKKLNDFQAGHVGELFHIQKSVEAINRNLEKRFKGSKKTPHVSISEDLANKLLQATDENRDAVVDEIMQSVADQMPSTWQDKWQAWRYLAMLANPRTHIRNLVGNAVFMPAVKLKNVIATGLETVYPQKWGLEARTKALKISKANKDFAKADFAKVENILSGGAKYDDSANEIESRKPVFKNKVLETIRKKNSAFLEKEDAIFLKAHYVASLAQYLEANKFDVSLLKEGDPRLEKARSYAIQEAQKATYRDFSAMSKWLNSSKDVPAARFFVDALLPFRKTPINILKRGVEYSPLGLAKSLSYGIYQMKTGKISASEFIDGIASGLTGTAIFGLGLLLTSLGVVQGGYDDEDEERFDKEQGGQAYSLKIGNSTYTIDWMAPLALPFFVGTETQAMLEGEGFSFDTLFTAAARITEPMFNLSMLEGLNSTIESVSYSDNKLTALSTEIVSTFLGQAFPTIGGQISRSIDKTQRQYYADKNSWVPEDVQYFLMSMMSKIPGLSYTMQPKIDVWGEEKTNGGWLARIIENFVSPGYFENLESNKVEKEIGKLYDRTGETSVLPDSAEKKITYNGEDYHFSPTEYTAFAQVRGRTAYDVIKALADTSEYLSATDAERVAMIEDAYEYADSIARLDVMPDDYVLPTSRGWVNKAIESGYAIEDYIAMRATVDDFRASDVTKADEYGVTIDQYKEYQKAVSGLTKKEEKLNAINSLDLTDAQKDALYYANNYAESKINEAPWH